MTKKFFIVGMLLATLFTGSAQFTSDSVLIENRSRSFHFKIPAQLKPGTSLLFLMHGSGGTGLGMAKTTSKLQAIADKENLIIVYPDAYEGFWNECRRYSTATANKEDLDEEGFFNAMINRFDSLYKIDRKKVFAAGMSGGGHMAYKLGLTMPGTIHAIAAIIANLPDAASTDCIPAGKAIPVMIINGTLDQINPYNGGKMIVNNSNFGVVRSSEESFAYWSSLAGYSGQPVKKLLPDTDPGDKKRIESYTYKSKNKPEITLLKVVGGKHDYPNDIDVFLYIWDFFKRSMTGVTNSPVVREEERGNSDRNHEKQRRRILTNMEKAMGKLPSRSALPPLNTQVTDSLKADTYTRYTINFSVAENERTTAYLYVPVQSAPIRKLPAMLVLHGTNPLGKGVVDGQGDKPNRAQAKELAQRGYVVIAPDYPGFGDLKDYDFETDRYESGTMKGIFNHMRCIDLLQAREDVDPERIGASGLSLGGHNSMFLGAFDTRVKVVVSASGWTQMDYYNVESSTSKFGGRLGAWAQDRYMPLLRDKFKLDEDKIPFDFDEVISAIAPRAFFSVSPLKDANFDVKGVVEGIAKVEKLYQALGAGNMLQVRYPDAGHDFPLESRKEAYQFIDKLFSFTPNNVDIK
jgi:poly(3-hydroxybutyrate) depolymerase